MTMDFVLRIVIYDDIYAYNKTEKIQDGVYVPYNIFQVAVVGS